MDDPSVRDANDIARELDVDVARGLSGTDAAKRWATDGPNELRSMTELRKVLPDLTAAEALQWLERERLRQGESTVADALRDLRGLIAGEKNPRR